MSKINYIPYNGGAGPEIEQRNNNTLYLGEKLKELNIPFSEDYEWGNEMFDEDNYLNLKLGTKVYVGYDRYGFCIDGIDELFDQASLEDTIKYIVNNKDTLLK